MTRINARDELLFAEEALIVDAQVAIHTLLEDQGWNRTDLARELGVSQARVTQMFSDTAKNLTLRTLARVFRALGQECQISCKRLDAIATEECAKAEKPAERSASKARAAAPDFASLMEFSERLETTAKDAYTSVSNDNFQVDALAA
jgi:DNA-binding Xre family transcriptional regulator